MQIERDQYTDYRRIESRRPTNCVIAALESAFHAPATKEERRLRDKLSDDKSAVLKRFRDQIQTKEDAMTVYKANLILETRVITDFFRRLQGHNTPLGRTMSQYDMHQEVISGEELSEVINPRRITFVAETSLKDEWHLMHAKQMQGGKIVSSNDRNTEIVLNDTAKYLVYHFEKK